MGGVSLRDLAVNPARAGMIRALCARAHARIGKPRASGDDPVLVVLRHYAGG